MVASGLEEGMLSVASYRLAVHLGLAFVILGLLAWYIFRLQSGRWVRNYRERFGKRDLNLRGLVEEGARLIVTVDCGTAGDAAISAANEAGAEVIVLDHHQTGEELPEAFAVVNPNRQDDLSGQGHLAAAGVVFLFLGPVVGPASLYYGAKGLEQKKAMGDSGGQARTWVLFVLGALEAVAGLWLIASMVSG